MTRLAVAAAAWLLLFASCKKGDCDSAKTGSGDAPTSARSVADLLGQASKLLPANASIVFALDAKTSLDAALDHGLGMLPVPPDPGGLREDLGRVYKRFVGVDLTRVDAVVGYASPVTQAGAVVITGDLGDIDVPGDKETIAGLDAVRLERDLFVARYEDVLLAGNKAGLEAITSDGEKLAGSDRLKTHEAALARTGAGVLIVSGQAGMLSAMALKNTPLSGSKIDHVSASLGTAQGGAAISIQADDATREKVRGFIDQGLGFARMQIERLASQIHTTESFEEALAGVGAKHFGPVILGLLAVEDSDGALTVSVRLEGMHQSVFVIGVLAAVAIPAFIKYMRRAKTTEAIDQLDKIYKAASSYYSAPRVQAGTGMKLPCQFPQTIGGTPSGSPCDHPDDRFPFNPSSWATATWSALNFQMNDAHYFRYSFESSGTLSNAKFTARAHADLDCDGTWSTFERYGYGDATSNMAECSMKGSSAFYKDKETE